MRQPIRKERYGNQMVSKSNGRTRQCIEDQERACEGLSGGKHRGDDPESEGDGGASAQQLCAVYKGPTHSAFLTLVLAMETSRRLK